MEWSNDRVLKFLELYRNEPVLWNPKLPSNKNKLKVQDSWTRISSTLNMPTHELKAKKNSLMATFRSHRRRKQASIQSGAEEDDIYQPIWFAYQLMEGFLAPVYNCGSTINTVDNDNASKLHQEEQQMTTCQNETQNSESPDDYHEVLSPHTEAIQDNTSRKSKCAEAIPASQRQKRRLLAREIDDTQDKIQKTFDTLNNVSTKNEDDECDLYGKLLAKKLRDFSTYERRCLMHEIDWLLLDKTPRTSISRSTSISPSRCSSSSSAPSSPQILLNRQSHFSISNPNSPSSALPHSTSAPNISNPSSSATPRYSQFLPRTLESLMFFHTAPHEHIQNLNILQQDGSTPHSDNIYRAVNNAGIPDLP